MNFICVGLGGGLGAIFRYFISLIPFKGTFPLLTLITNLLGAIFIGLIVGFSFKKKISANSELFFKTGFCGGFTTFSTFSLESFSLLKSGHIFLMCTYIILSVLMCLLGVIVGNYISQKIA